MNVLGDIEDSSGHRAEAEKWYREVLAIRRRLLPHEDPKLAISLNNVGGVTARAGISTRPRRCTGSRSRFG
jgi:hypothetical protein